MIRVNVSDALRLDVLQGAEVFGESGLIMPIACKCTGFRCEPYGDCRG